MNYHQDDRTAIPHYILSVVVPSSLVAFGVVILKAAVISIRVPLVGAAHAHLGILFAGIVAILVIFTFITSDTRRTIT